MPNSSIERVKLEITNVSKAFGGKQALRNVSLKAEQGELVGLVGANGGGKTTLLRLLLGGLIADSGLVQMFGEEPPYDQGIKKRIGYVSQQLSLYPDLTVYENIRFHADVYDEFHSRSALANHAEKFDLAPFLGTRVSGLSGGWARVAQLACNLVHSPSVLLLDEPTAGLDASMRAHVWSLLNDYTKQGGLVVISTHDLDEAQQCDKLTFLSDGEEVFSGWPRAILENCGLDSLFIKNKGIIELPDVLTDQDMTFILQPFLGGVKAIYQSLYADRFATKIAASGGEFEFLQPSLADVCAFNLAARA